MRVPEPKEPFDCAYVVACFEGRRPNVDTTYHLDASIDRHLGALAEYDTSDAVRISKVLFVVNQAGVETVSEENLHRGGRDVTIVRRPNNGYSYGAWAHAVEILLERSAPHSHAFLIEDDYLPSIPGFLEAFLDRPSNAGFVAQKLAAIPGVAPNHAATSNGLLDLAAARRTKEIFGTPFMYYPFELTADDYTLGCENPIAFFSLLELAGFPLDDISDRWSVPHLSNGVITERGNSGAPAPLVPTS